MKKDFTVDFEGLTSLLEYQIKERVNGILAVGTTGESPVLNWNDHERVLEKVYECVNSRILTIAGTGSNSTEEAIAGTSFAEGVGIKAILLVDPYYNGPSSLEIRKEYIQPIAYRFSEIQIIPYIIPGRTGTQLLPQDLAILHSDFTNVNAVKEATGDLRNMELTRKLCGDNFDILSGDDDKTSEMMVSPQIKAAGVISVTSNIVPGAVHMMVQEFSKGNIRRASEISKALDPLFKIVTVKTEEDTPFGRRIVKARNPLPYKTLMNILGIPAGPCKQPLGKMTQAGLNVILEQVRKVYENDYWILQPLENFFDVDLNERLYNELYWKDLCYV